MRNEEIVLGSVIEPCACGSVLCYACRSAKMLLVMASDLERLYPGNMYMQKRAAQLRELGLEWLEKAAQQVAARLERFKA